MARRSNLIEVRVIRIMTMDKVTMTMMMTRRRKRRRILIQTVNLTVIMMTVGLMILN